MSLGSSTEDGGEVAGGQLELKAREDIEGQQDWVIRLQF